MSARFHLHPVVAVEYWRAMPTRLVPVSNGPGAVELSDFAILSTWTAKGCKFEAVTSIRFELPAQADQLRGVIAAIDAAYALGHHDNRNRMRRQFGLDALQTVRPVERGADDRA